MRDGFGQDRFAVYYAIYYVFRNINIRNDISVYFQYAFIFFPADLQIKRIIIRPVYKHFVPVNQNIFPVGGGHRHGVCFGQNKPLAVICIIYAS